MNQGMRTSAICSVVAGDPPIAISWEKDGAAITANTANLQGNQQLTAVNGQLIVRVNVGE